MVWEVLCCVVTLDLVGMWWMKSEKCNRASSNTASYVMSEVSVENVNAAQLVVFRNKCVAWGSVPMVSVMVKGSESGWTMLKSSFVG